MDKHQNIQEHKLTQTIFALGKPSYIKRGTMVTRQGDLMSQMYFIKHGIVRGYYLDEEGNEVTKCFSAEGDIFCVEGFLYQRPASYFIECIEEVDGVLLTYEEVREWIAQDPKNADLVSQMIINALRVMEERARSLLLMDAKERYENFFRDYGKIADRLKQKYIASYLGINEASFCRLKKKIDLGQ